jgi:hypothetical protein
MQEYPLEIADSGPHGLVEDNGGNIWFTAVSQAYVGMLDPNSGDVTEYYVPDDIRGPHTPILDQQGNLWFTLQSGHVGRLVPKTKEMTIAATPTTGTYPYRIPMHVHDVSLLHRMTRCGIRITLAVIWVDLFPKLGKFRNGYLLTMYYILILYIRDLI